MNQNRSLENAIMRKLGVDRAGAREIIKKFNEKHLTKEKKVI